MSIIPIDSELVRLFVGSDVGWSLVHFDSPFLSCRERGWGEGNYGDGVGGGTTARKFAAAQPARVLS